MPRPSLRRAEQAPRKEGSFFSARPGTIRFISGQTMSAGTKGVPADFYMSSVWLTCDISRAFVKKNR